MSINEVQDEVIAEFNDFDDWMDRYQLLIDLGNEQEPLDDKYWIHNPVHCTLLPIPRSHLTYKFLSP